MCVHNFYNSTCTFTITGMHTIQLRQSTVIELGDKDASRGSNLILKSCTESYISNLQVRDRIIRNINYTLRQMKRRYNSFLHFRIQTMFLVSYHSVIWVVLFNLIVLLIV